MSEPTKPPAPPKRAPDSAGDVAVLIVVLAIWTCIVLAAEHWAPPALRWTLAQIHDLTRPWARVP